MNPSGSDGSSGSCGQLVRVQGQLINVPIVNMYMDEQDEVDESGEEYFGDFTDVGDYAVNSAKKRKVQPSGTDTLRMTYEQLWNSKDLSDVVIICSTGERVKAHKFKLMVFSPVFREMFESGMIESNRNEIRIEEFTEGTVEALLKYMYTGLLDMCIDRDELKEILKAADKYQVDGLKEAVFSSLLGSITVSWVGELVKLAGMYNASAHVKAKIQKFLMNYRRQLSNDEDFRRVVKEHGAIVLEFIFENFDDN